jgi:hypothetical protein
MIAGHTASTCCKKISVASGAVATLFDLLSTIREFLIRWQSSALIANGRVPQHQAKMLHICHSAEWFSRPKLRKDIIIANDRLMKNGIIKALA